MIEQNFIDSWFLITFIDVNKRFPLQYMNLEMVMPRYKQHFYDTSVCSDELYTKI